MAPGPGQVADAAGSGKRSSLRRLGSWSGGKLQERESEPWRVGGCYAVGRCGARLHQGPDLREVFGRSLCPGERVFLLAIESGQQPPVGLVLPLQAGSPGWMMLEDPSVKGEQSRNGPLERACLKDSWEVGARYLVHDVATLRKSPSLSSNIVGEARPGDEVIVLDVGVNDSDTDMWHRLRVMVRLPEGAVGWMSPLSGSGDTLLDNCDLLGPAAVERHRRSLRATRRRWNLCAAVRCGGERRVAARPRRSFQLGRPVPWQIGGCYRLLERAALRREPSLSGAEAGRLPAGALVTVREAHVAECKRQGWCPCVYVEVLEGEAAGMEGWLRCSAPRDGHDLLDTRDQNEYEDLVRSLSSPLSAGEAPQEVQAEGRSSGSGGSPLSQSGEEEREEEGGEEEVDEEQQRKQEWEGEQEGERQEEPSSVHGQCRSPQPWKRLSRGSGAACESLCAAGLLRFMGLSCGWARVRGTKLLSD